MTDNVITATDEGPKPDKFPALVPADRCDRDGVSQAFVRFIKPGVFSKIVDTDEMIVVTGEIKLCAHHTHKLHDDLIAGGWVIESDIRHILSQAPTSCTTSS